MKLLQKPETLCLVLVYFFGSLNHILCCVDSLVSFKDEGYATFELPGTAADKIDTTVVLAFPERLTNNNTGHLQLAEEADAAQSTLKNKGIVKYKIIFPISNEIPRIVEITKDDKIICAKERRSPKTTITLYNSFRIPANRDEIDKDTFIIENLQKRIPRGADDVSCGQNKEDLPLIYKGNAVSKGDWPWLAALFHSEADGRIGYVCGGTVVSRTAIVTAAHCLEKPLRVEEYYVVVGRHHVNKLTEGQTLEVSEILIHSSFRSISDLDADLAIVRTGDAIRFSDNVRPACVWLEETTTFTDVVGEEGQVVGWGATEKEPLSNEPLKVTAPIVSKETCENYHPKLKTLNTLRGFCAGKLDGSGPCYGDGGAGLLVKYNKRWYLRGIVSVKIDVESCSDKSYVFYTDAAQFTRWINDNKD